MPEHKRPRVELGEMIGHGSDMRVYADADPAKVVKESRFWNPASYWKASTI